MTRPQNQQDTRSQHSSQTVSTQKRTNKIRLGIAYNVPIFAENVYTHAVGSSNRQLPKTPLIVPPSTKRLVCMRRQPDPIQAQVAKARPRFNEWRAVGATRERWDLGYLWG